MRKTFTLFTLFFSLLTLSFTVFAGGGGSNCTGGTALSCASPVNTSTGNCVGCDPTNANNGGGACCWAGADINCDGTQDLTYSVEDMKGFTYTVPAGIACGSTYTITITTAANLQGNMYNTTQGGGINAGHVTTDEFGSSWMGGGSFTLTTTACAGDDLQIVIDGYAGTTGNFTIELTCPVACTPPTLSSTTTNATCGVANGAINLTTTGGTSPFTYSWTNGATVQDIASLLAGTYTVTVTATGGCTATRSVTVVDTGAPTLSATTTSATCGASNGAINLTVSGGVSPFTYSWTNSATTEDISSLATGSYTVTVTGSNSCTATLTATVAVTGIPLISLVSQTNPTCFGGTNGALDINVTGGVSPYTYNWTGGVTTQDRTGLIAGTYNVTVTTNGGCTATSSYVIVDPVPITATTTVTNATCPTNTNGAIDLFPAGGSGGLKYVWTTGATTQDVTGLTPGSYTVTVTDGKSCTATFSAVVSSSGIPVISLVLQTNILCNGASTGALDISVSGGVAPYTYSWSNGASSQDITGLIAGAYLVTVTETNLCTATATWTITQPTAITITTTSVTDLLCPCEATGAINITVTNGTPGYTYSWSNSASTQDITGILGGSYTVTVTDANLCTKTSTIAVAEPAPIAISLVSSVNPTCNGVCNGQATFSTSGGTGLYDYSNNGGGSYQFNNQAGNVTYTTLCTGASTIVVRDANGCITP